MSFAGAVKIDTDRVLGIVDSQIIEEGNGQYEFGKKNALYGNGAVFFVGDVNNSYEMRRELETPIKGRRIGFSDYLENMKSVYNNIFLSRVEQNVLTKFNLDWPRFEQGKFPNQMTSEIASQLKDFDESYYDNEIIFLSCDDDKKAQIVSINRPEGARFHDTFYTAGSTDSAKKIFSKKTSPNQTYIDVSLPEAMLTLAEVMKDVSDTAFIGGRFNLFDINGFNVNEIEPKKVDCLVEIYSSKKPREEKIQEVISEVLSSDKTDKK